MVRLIDEQKNKDGTTILRMNPIGKLFSDANYLINMVVCPDPTCDCGSSTVHIVKEENLGTHDAEYRLPIDVHEERVYTNDNESFYAKEGNGTHIPGLLSDGLTSEDWESLRATYHSRKFKQIEYTEADDLDFEFDEKYHEEMTLMFPYYEVFPCSMFLAELDGKSYEVFDTYCKNPTCPCTNLRLNIIAWTKSKEGEYSAKAGGSYHYDYKTKAGKVDDGNRTIVSSVIRQVFSQHDNIDKLFDKRHQVVKRLYTKSRLAYDRERHPKPLIKISRNQLCPCGSGKKYKRCCMKKHLA